MLTQPLSTQAIIEKFHDLHSGKERVEYFRSLGLTLQDIDDFVLSPTYQEQVSVLEAKLKSRSAPGATEAPIASIQSNEPLLQPEVADDKIEAIPSATANPSPELEAAALVEASFFVAAKPLKMITDADMRRYATEEYRDEQRRGLRPGPVPCTTVNPAKPTMLESLIDDIECLGDFQNPSTYNEAAKYLRSFGFGQEAIANLLADISHEKRLTIAYFEAVRLQQQRATDGAPEKTKKIVTYPVKTLTFDTSATDPSGSVDEKKADSVEAHSHLIESRVADDEFVEVPFVPANAIPAAPTPASQGAVAATVASPLPVVATPSKTSTSIRKSTLPEDTIEIANAHYPSDRAGTLRQSQLVKWIPEIKTLPNYTAFDLFGELSGELVDLVFYVNREETTCYIGDKYDPSSPKRKVTWDPDVLGHLPKKGEKLLLRVITINPWRP